jgi:predicted DNA-binding transcriptional regulator YafY
MESITAPLGEQDTRWHEDRIIVPPVPSVQFPPEVWNTVCEGIQKNHALSFDYRPDWQSGYTPRYVYPYQLLFDNGAWYLFAYLKKAGDRRTTGMRMYSLSRIKNISVEKEKFTFPASADFRVRTDGSYFGAYSTEKKQNYRIAFYNDAAMRVKERLWAADQKIKETKEGVILSFSSSQYGKVLELVLANGKDALPLAPAELVKDWKENLKGMRERADSPKTSRRDAEAPRTRRR